MEIAGRISREFVCSELVSSSDLWMNLVGFVCCLFDRYVSREILEILGNSFIWFYIWSQNYENLSVFHCFPWDCKYNLMEQRVYP